MFDINLILIIGALKQFLTIIDMFLMAFKFGIQLEQNLGLF